MKFNLMRGLMLPDPNFLYGIDDGKGWESQGIDTLQRGGDSQAMAGVYEKIDIDGALFGSDDCILSGVTPRGVAGYPFNSGAKTVTMWLGALVKTSTWSSNSNRLVMAEAQSVKSNGVVGTVSGLTYLDHPDNSQYFGSDKFTLLTGAVQWEVDSDCSYYKMRIAFRDMSSGTSSAAYITWAGMAPLINTTNPFDALDSNFDAQVSDGFSTPGRAQSPAGTIRPRSSIGQVPITPRWVNLNFPYMSIDDREHFEKCFQWNKGTATQNTEAYCDTNKCNVFDRGSQQPVIICMQKDGMKHAFYANMPSLNFSQALDYFPDDNAMYQCAATFQEVTQ